MTDLTALLLTFNEKENIERTLAALRWVDRVVIVDSSSTDGTIQLAQGSHPSIEVFTRPFDTFAAQCNFGLAQVRTRWVLSLDADYVLTPELIEEIKGLMPPSEIAGYSAAFRYCVLGRKLRSSLYPPRTVLYRRESAHYEEDGHAHRVRISGNVQPLNGKINLDDRKPLSRWLQSQDQYFKIEARHLLTTPNAQLNRPDRLRKRVYFAPAAIFLYLLFGRGLIFSGWPGWYYVAQRTLAELLLSLRLITERERLESTDLKAADTHAPRRSGLSS